MSKQLLVPLDGSPLADAAIPYALDIAQRTKGSLLLVRVHSPAGMMPFPIEAPIYLPDPQWDERVRDLAKTWVAEKAATLARSTGVPVSHEFLLGDPAAEIAELANTRGVGAIVCSTHGAGGLAPHWLGSVADAVIRHARCPVIALPPNAVLRSDGLHKMLVLLDGSGVADAILPHAAWLAGAFNTDIELLSVVASPWFNDSLAMLAATDADRFGIDAAAVKMKEYLDRTATQLREKGLRVRTVVEVGGNPTKTILAHIAHANPDTVAMATHGRGLSRLFLGSIADKVLRSGGRPTLLFRLEPDARATEVDALVRAGEAAGV